MDGNNIGEIASCSKWYSKTLKAAQKGICVAFLVLQRSSAHSLVARARDGPSPFEVAYIGRMYHSFKILK